jgi:GT2 family glycosyltransferase
VFVDDDCTAEPGWLPALVAAHRARPEAFIQGRVDPDPDELERARVYWTSRAVYESGPWYPSCNIAYPRALLERLVGFDETYHNPAGEDTDLAWRALELGVPDVFADDARVRHAVHSLGVVGLVRDASRWGDMVRVVKRHPGLRRHFVHRVFWVPTHERAFVLVAGMALARRTRGASLLLALPYFELYRHHHSSLPRAVVSLPGHLVGDLAQIAALARASARHRTLVL